MLSAMTAWMEVNVMALLDSERAVQPFSSEAVTLMQVDESTMVG
jgi:hypothetical protein